jgi:nicotinamide phosphoribosyltransferase
MSLLNWYDHTGSDKSLIDFALHDLGFRGVSSVETAGIGAAAHLINFKSTNTIPGLFVARNYYNCSMAGYSIPTADHNTIISWGKPNELKAYENMLNQFPNGLMTVISDSYDVSEAIWNLWGNKLKNKIETRDGTFIIGLDSGEPVKTILRLLVLLESRFGTTTNSKKKKFLNAKIRIMQNDSMDLKLIENILEQMSKQNWAAENISFGSGSGLLQKINRDTLNFTLKCSSVTINGQENPVFKNPIDDRKKKSKMGRLKLIETSQGLKTVTENEQGEDLLMEVFRNGDLLVDQTLDEIRELAFVE